MTVACPECGKSIPRDQTFCKFCGALVASEDPVSPPVGEASVSPASPPKISVSPPAGETMVSFPAAAAPAPQPPAEKPRSSKLAAILAGVAALLVVAGGTAWFVISRSKPWQPGLSFTASAAEVTRGQQVTLQWSAADTASMRLNDEPVPASGSRAVSPAATTTYRLTASSRGGESQSRELTVRVIEPSGPPAIQFSGDRSRITKGESVTLNWSVTGATHVGIEPDVGAVEASGTRAVSPERSTEYIITAEGTGGSDKRSFKVQVDAAPAKKTEALVTPPPPGKKDAGVTPTPTPPPKTDTGTRPPAMDVPRILAFEAEPATAQQCQVVLLRWTVKGATRVTIDPAIGNVPPDGYRPVMLPRTTSYALKADGPGGTATQNVTITVAPGNRPNCR